MLWEMTVIGSVFPLYDGLNAFVLLTWWHTGNLNYVEHHVMNAVWTMSKTCVNLICSKKCCCIFTFFWQEYIIV